MAEKSMLELLTTHAAGLLNSYDGVDGATANDAGEDLRQIAGRLTDEELIGFYGGAAIESELRHWGWEPPSESMLRLCAVRVVEAVLAQAMSSALEALPRHERLACLLCGGLAPGEASGSADLCQHDPPLNVERILARGREAEAHLWALMVWFGGRYDNPYTDRDVAAAGRYVNQHLAGQDMATRHRAVLGVSREPSHG